MTVRQWEPDFSVLELVEILRQQLMDGELPRNSEYVWDSEAGEFRVLKELIH